MDKWADTNKMKFNANKFELLRYGKEKEINFKNLNIIWRFKFFDDKEQVKNLSIMMSNKAIFTLHIRNIAQMARDKMGWVLRVFQSRKHSLMLTLLKSLIISLLKYCCHLCNPWKPKDIQAIEDIQRTLTYKITEVQHLNYWERLHYNSNNTLSRDAVSVI